MWYNPMMRGLLKSPFHSIISKNTMLMTYTGRKSGKTYTTPMNYLALNGALYTTSYRDRVWWRNLRGGADVTLSLRGEKVPARAETIEDQSDVADALQQYLKTAPQFAKYMDVKLDEAGDPDSEDITRLAQNVVMVRTQLNGHAA
jgi:deazaflavin-dependent oxidoreductase (nitroreductase family)